MRKTLFFVFILGVIYSLYTVAIWRLNDGFALSKIDSRNIFTKDFPDQKPLKKKIEKLLNQDFYYLGKGSQCFVFESEDKEILKFFRMNRYRLPKISSYISAPSFLREGVLEKRREKERKLEALFASCQIAYKELKDDAGLLYMHLNPTSHLKKQITLHDKLKRTYTISLDDYSFLLQKRGEQVFPYLARLIEEGKEKEAEVALKDLVSLLTRRINKGIGDHDAVIHKNAGFCQEKAQFLDVGEFAMETCRDLDEELWQLTKELRGWLQKKDPNLAHYLERIIATR
jgi:hypothetical protein